MANEPSHVTRILATADGRQLEVLSTGPEDGPVLLFHNGTPGGLVASPDMAAAADVAAVLDGLGGRQFVTVGWSGGGPHALACAALLPGRCLAAASLAGVAPAQAAGLDWMAGMGPENVTEFTAAGQGEAALTAFLEEASARLGQVTAHEVAEELGGLISAADRAVV